MVLETIETMCDYNMCGTNLEEGEERMTNVNTPEPRPEVRRKYDSLFWRQPNVYAVAWGALGTRMES